MIELLEEEKREGRHGRRDSTCPPALVQRRLSAGGEWIDILKARHPGNVLLDCALINQIMRKKRAAVLAKDSGSTDGAHSVPSSSTGGISFSGVKENAGKVPLPLPCRYS